MAGATQSQQGEEVKECRDNRWGCLLDSLCMVHVDLNGVCFSMRLPRPRTTAHHPNGSRSSLLWWSRLAQRFVHVLWPPALRLVPFWSPVQSMARITIRTRCTANTVLCNCVVTAGIRTVRTDVSSCPCHYSRAWEGIRHQKRDGIASCVEGRCNHGGSGTWLPLPV